MKKIIQIVTAVLIATAGFGGLASAATCSGNFTITGTGAGSNNTISCSDITNVTSTCTNNGIVLDYNDQNGNSGTATVTDNSTGGTASSGTISNSNGSTVDLSTACAAAAPTTPGKTTPTHPAGGKGAFMPASLPYTGDSSILTTILAGIAVAISLAVFSRLAVAAIRRVIVR